MRDAWEDPAFAQEWDREAAHGNPSRADQMALLAHLVVRLTRGGSLLDIGGGSGQLEAAVLPQLPQARCVVVDGSRPMLDIARRRLAPFLDRVTLIEADFARVPGLDLPHGPYDVAVSMQALHHVGDDAKRAVARRVHDLLVPGGVYLWGDRLTLAGTALRPVYGATWEHWDRGAPRPSGASAEAFFARYADKEDFPATLERHLEILRAAGFTPACLQLYLNRAVFAGVKPGFETADQRR